MNKPTLNELVERYLTSRDNAIAKLNDKDALDSIYIFPTYSQCVKDALTVSIGFRFRHNNKLYKVLQPTLTFNNIYTPGVGTESLYAEITLPDSGSDINNPIEYSGNMALEEGKYYKQNEIIYVCIRDTINPVYASLADLIDLYVQIAE